MTSSRSATGPRTPPTFWVDTAAISPRRQSFHLAPPCRSDSCQTTPTRGPVSLSAMRSSKQVRRCSSNILSYTAQFSYVGYNNRVKTSHMPSSGGVQKYLCLCVSWIFFFAFLELANTCFSFFDEKCFFFIHISISLTQRSDIPREQKCSPFHNVTRFLVSYPDLCC